MQNISVTNVKAHPGDSAFLLSSANTTVLVDTGFAFTGHIVAENVRCALGERPLDYIFLTHSHYDHALGSAYVLKKYPMAKVVAGSYASGIFAREGAKRVMRDLDKKAAAAAGITAYEDLIDDLRVDIPVNDGDRIIAGDMEFTAIHLPGHTKCSFGFYMEKEKFLIGSETLGVYYGGNDVWPCYLIGYRTAMESISRVEKMDIENILLPHFGLVSGEKAKWYLNTARRSAVDTAETIAAMLKSGKTKEDALNFVKDRFYHGSVKTIYPPDAMVMNTNIMIDLIEKELL